MSMRPYGGFTFTFENEAQASEAYPIIKKETAKTMAVWGEAVKQDGGMVTVDMKTDLGDEYNEDATFSNIQSMVELCWMNGIRPVLCSLLPSYRFFWRPDAKDPLRKLESLNARMKEYCERHGITYVDYHAALVGPDGHRIRTEFAEDTVHPNVAGYEIMEDLLLKALNIK